jgi:hypothetical protein
MGEDLGFPGNRELLERQLAKAATQVLFLAHDARPGRHTLAERGAEMIRGVEVMPSEERFWAEDSPPADDVFTVDIAEAYAAAKTEVKTLLAEAFPS